MMSEPILGLVDMYDGIVAVLLGVNRTANTQHEEVLCA
jgi:hypothetical protein